MNCTNGVCSWPSSSLPSDVLQDNNDTETTVLFMPTDDVEWSLYGASWCSYCRKAKDLLYTMFGEDNVYYYDIGCMDKKEFIDHMSTLTNGQQTIPMIFNKKEFIGGYTNLVDFLSKL